MSRAPASETPPPAPTPRATLFATFAWLWCFPSAGALWLLGANPAWWYADGLHAGLAAVRLEQWIAVGILALHVWFLWRWRRVVRAA